MRDSTSTISLGIHSSRIRTGFEKCFLGIVSYGTPYTPTSDTDTGVSITEFADRQKVQARVN